MPTPCLVDCKAPFDPSMMVQFRKRFSDEDLRRMNELIVERGKQLLTQSAAVQQDDDDHDGKDVRRDDHEAAAPLFMSSFLHGYSAQSGSTR